MKTITVDLSTSGVQKAIRELEKYRKDIEKKTKLLQKKVADRLQELIKQGFAGKPATTLVDGTEIANNVSVYTKENGNIVTVIADGTDAVWIEFGAGVHFNGTPGGSPNPYGVALQYTIGSYGKGHGKQDFWVYYDPSGETDEKGDKKKIYVYGTRAEMPMARAIETIINEFPQMAREVFK